MKIFTYSVRAALLCLMLNVAAVPLFSQQIEKHLVLPTNEQLGFLEYKPANYATEGDVKHPVILFLHGIGERGNGTTELRNVARVALPRMIRLGHNMKFTWNGKTETFLVLSPQCPSRYYMWPEMIVNEMIKYAKENLRIDTNRIYITGLSMGGGGTYRFISRRQKQAETVAAAATICAPCLFEGDGSTVANASLPLWSFHAANDSITPVSCTESAVSRINSLNPPVKALKTIWPDGGHNVWDRVYTDTSYRFNGIVNIYEWFLGQSNLYQPNKLPVARAGNNISVTPAHGKIKLDASASYDADGKIVRYVWKKISGPAAGVIAQKMSTSASTYVSGLTSVGEYQFQLAVVDDRASYTLDTLKIIVSNVAESPVDTTVKPAPVPVDSTIKDTTAPPSAVANIPPVARTTPDREIPLSWNYFPVISAWPSTDTDGYIARFKWEKVSGPSIYKIESPYTCATRVSGLVAGVYIFRVTAFDNKGASSSADVKITITKKNLPPVARVTADRVIPIEWNYFPVVSGYPSTDEDGYIARFKWEKVMGPDTFNIVSPNTCATRVNNLVPGVYVFRVTAYDNLGASSYADVKITMTSKTSTTAVSGMIASNAVVEDVQASVPTTRLMVPSSVKLFPNPAHSMTTIEYSGSDEGRSLIRIYDVTGKTIKTIAFNKTSFVYRHQLDISKLPDGMYYVEISTGNTIGRQTQFVKK